jgi:2-dehydropantoate 2-reductase
MRVGIIGVGGVGGFYGGKLAYHYTSGQDTEIAFLARGPHLERIRGRGLRLITPDGECLARPALATDDPKSLGNLDLVIFSVKGYDLEETAASLKQNLGGESVVLPLLNGVGNAESLASVLGHGRILNGCVYLSAHMEAPGIVRHVGGPGQLYFGPEEGSPEPYRSIEALLKEAGIPAELKPNIREVVWEKYIFISPLASVTSLRRESIGEVLEGEESRALTQGLMEEVARLAHAKGVRLPDDIVASSLDKGSGFPRETKTSMQLDFEQDKKTELETFTGYVVKTAQALGIDAPLHGEVYAALKKMSKP